MKNEKLQEFKSDVSIIEKNVVLWNCLNPDDYIIEFWNCGILAEVIVISDLNKAFFIFDSIRNSIRYEIAKYEEKKILA
jgi:hypothetical protein